MPVAISGTSAEYFVPSLLASVVADAIDETPAMAATAALAAPWLLDAARSAISRFSAFDTDGTTSRAMGLLTHGPPTADQLRIARSALAGCSMPAPWRDSIAWVNGHTPQNAKLVPPPSSAIGALIDDLCVFLVRTDMPLWIKQAFAYYQFVHIHPFADGNGRMSRLLVASLGASTSIHRTRSMIVAIALCLHRKAFIRHFDAMQAGSSDTYLTIWRQLDAWAAGYAADVAMTQSRLLSTLTELVGNNNSRRLFDRFASGGPLTTPAMAALLNGSTKNASRNIERLRDAGWINGPDNAFVAEPIRAAQRDLVLDIARGSAAILV